MTPEEILLAEIIKLHSQVYEDQDDIKIQMIEAITGYGNEKKQEGHMEALLVVHGLGV